MINRNIVPLVLSLSLTVTGILAPLTVSAKDAGVQTAATQGALTPAAALQHLKDGNKRFLTGDTLDRDLQAQVKATSTGQYPHSIVLSCIDSRVPPELVFDQGIGDIFAPRVAGNYVDTDMLGNMEFGAAVAGSKLIVVLGHSECGAVKGACDNVKLGNLTHTLTNLAPAVYEVTDVAGERNSKNKAFVDAVAHKNVNLMVENILARSSVLSDLVDDGKLKVVGAMYDVSTGAVTFMD